MPCFHQWTGTTGQIITLCATLLNQKYSENTTFQKHCSVYLYWMMNFSHITLCGAYLQKHARANNNEPTLDPTESEVQYIRCVPSDHTEFVIPADSYIAGRVRHVITLIYNPHELNKPLPHPIPQLRRGSLEGFSALHCHIAVICWINKSLQ